MRLILLLCALFVPAAASARETIIRCDVKARMSGIMGNYGNDDVTSRYYVVNDTARTVARLSEGRREPICWSEAQCTITVNADAVVFTSDAWPGGNHSVGRTIIDRRFGMLNESHQLYNQQGQPTVYTEVRGPCRPVAPDHRAF